MQPNADQAAVLESIGRILQHHRDLPKQGRRSFYDPALDQALEAGGYYVVASEPSLGPITAALAIDAIARSPAVVECVASMLVAPELPGEVQRPIALVWDIDEAARFLPVAKTAIVLDGAEAVVVPVGSPPAALQSSLAYPYARLPQEADLRTGQRLSAEVTERVLARWRAGLAIEMGAAMAAATDFTVAYVTQRRQFGRPIGSFQAVQHRLAQAAVHAEGARWLGLEAAWTGDGGEAALAALYAQLHGPALVNDLHQFNGAIGVTLDHGLHYWTYRLVGLQSELGGVTGQGRAATSLAWA